MRAFVFWIWVRWVAEKCAEEIGLELPRFRTAFTGQEALVGRRRSDYTLSMKVITVTEAEGRLAEIIYKVMKGEGIVLKDGDREVCLTPRPTSELNPQEDSPELEAELLKSADQASQPFSFEELRAVGKRLIREHRQK